MVIFLSILLFSFLIFIHELGHFVAAKLSGVQVNEFAIFMGPAIVKWKRGETLYAIRCIPIGGYCAMEGEDEETDNPKAFTRAKWWKRLIILVSGAGMNFVAGLVLLAVLIFPMNQMITPTVSHIMEGASLSEGNAILPGDEILKVAGESIYVQPDFSLVLSVKGSGNHDVLVRRDGKRVLLEDVNFTQRQLVDSEGRQGSFYGVEFTRITPGFGDKLKQTFLYGIDYVRTVRLSLQMLFNGSAGLKDMSGPVGIVDQMSTSAAQTDGFLDALNMVLSFGALIAINLAVMNLLPFPALDGGRVFGLLVTTALEKITKKKLDPKYEGYIHAIGMVLLLALMAIITFKDIFMIFKR